MLKYVLILAGLGFLLLGLVESQIAAKAGDEPTEVTAAQLEDGEIPENIHVRVTGGIAYYEAAIYEWPADGAAKPEDRIPMASFPLVSPNHPFIEAIDAAKDGETVKPPEFDDFDILVRTNRFKKRADIPEGLIDGVTFQGIIVNDFAKLDGAERKLYKKRFPNLDPSKVIIIEEGREIDAGRGLALMGSGALLMLIGIVWFVYRVRK